MQDRMWDDGWHMNVPNCPTSLFFKKNHQFITRGAKADRGKYIVPT